MSILLFPSPPSRKLSLGIFYILFEAFYFHRVVRSFHFHYSQSSCSSTEAKTGLKPREFSVAEPLPPAGFPWYLLSPAVPTKHRPDPSSLCCQQGMPICCVLQQKSQKMRVGDDLRRQSSVSAVAQLIVCLSVPSKFNSVNPTGHLGLPGILYPINHIQCRHFIPIFSGWLFAAPAGYLLPGF